MATSNNVTQNKYLLPIIFVLILIIIGLCISNAGLKTQIAQLTKEKEEISVQLTAKEQELQNINLEINAALNRLEAFKAEIEESMLWFKDNSDISYLSEYAEIKNYIKRKCLNINEDTCTIKLSCFPLALDIRQFYYEPDIITSSMEDKLQSLSQFYANRGGDCEDFSLVVNAALNYAENYCKERGATDIVLEAAKEGGNEYTIVFEGTWYYNDASRFELPEDYTYHYIVCGLFPSELYPEYATGETAAHCTLAFTNIKIANSKDVYDALKNSIIVEPQSGFLVYDLRSPSEMHIPKDGDDYIPTDYFIYATITDNDYYLFGKGETLTWAGYSDFIPLIDNLQNNLELLKN